MQIFRKSLLLTAALALTAFAACSNDDNENGGDGKETDPDYLALPHAYGTYYPVSYTHLTLPTKLEV